MTIKPFPVPRPARHPFSPSHFLRRAWHSSIFYRFTLMGRAPKYFGILPPDPWPGDIQAGRLAADGRLMLGRHIISLSDLWMPLKVDAPALDALHQFTWLRDLRAIGDNSARRLCRQLIVNWIERNQDWRLFPWRVGVTGQRIANWIALYDFFCSSADEGFREMFFREVARQTRHLAYAWQDASTPLERLQSLKGLVYAAITFPGESNRLDTLLPYLENELQLQLLPDGGHHSRSPQIHLLVLRDLIDIRAMLRLIHYAIPPFIQKYIGLMVPVVRLFRHGDGGLASFGGISQIPSPVIDMVLSLADVRGRPPEHALALGFERAVNKSSLILFNAGSRLAGLPASAGEEGTGSLNFEWSVGQNRLVLQGDIILQTARGKPLQLPDRLDPGSIQLYRMSKEGHTLLEGAYAHPDGLPYRHRRQLCISGNRADLRGEDTLCVNNETLYAIRFVLDEKFEVSLINGGRSGLIRMLEDRDAETAESRQWRLLVSGAEQIVSEPSAASQSIFLLGRLKANQPASIQWAFRQV